MSRGVVALAAPSTWVLIPTLGASWIALAQVVSFQGLAIWVIGGSLLTVWVVTLLAGARRRLLSVLAGVGMSLGVAFLADTLGGDSAGPITRAALMASACAAAMVWSLHTRYPAAVLAPSLLLLGGALGLGAAGDVFWLVGLWSVAAAVTLVSVGPYRRIDLADRHRLLPLAAMLAAAGLVAVIVGAGAALILDQPWTMPGAGALAPVPVSDPVSDPASDSAPSRPPDVESPAASLPTAPPPASPPPAEQEQIMEESIMETLISWLVVAVALLLALAVLAAVLQALWWGWVALRWRLLRRRLDSGGSEQRAIGAWDWVRLRRARFDRPLPAHVSPDVALSLGATWGDADLIVVAYAASEVAFAPNPFLPNSTADAAWHSALLTGRAPVGSWRQQWRWRNRDPRWAARALGGNGSRSVNAVTVSTAVRPPQGATPTL